MGPASVVIETCSAAETREAGRRLGAALAGGDVVGLVGELGAGKTQLTKGIAVGLGVADDRAVNSPTFVLTNEYEGRVHIFHLDAYRLRSAAELEALGFEEMCNAGGVVIVEWADRVRALMPPDTLWIELVPTGDETRQLTAQGGRQGLAAALHSQTGSTS